MKAPRFISTLFLLVTLGCPEKEPDPIAPPPPPPECNAGSFQVCMCSGGLSGTRTCDAAGQWNECTCECAADCMGRTCGLDPVCQRLSCGTCGQDQICSDAGQCVADCTAACVGRECGTEPLCGTSCGTCEQGATCDETAGQCNATQLSLDGRTIPGANISARVGTSTPIEATSDAGGRYYVSLGAPGANPNAIVSVRATGTGANAHVALVSVAGTIGELTAAAGADLIVEETEHNGVLVTPASTAKYAALYAANSNKSPETATERDDAEENLDEPLSGIELFDVAAAIQMIIGSGGALDLPTGFATTLELAEDIYALRALIGAYEFTEPYSPHPLGIGRNAILEADENHAKLDPAELTTYFSDMLKTRNGFIGGGNVRWDFDAAGTGVFQDTIDHFLPPLQNFTWSMEQDHLAIMFDSPMMGDAPFLTTDQIAARITDPNVRQQVELFLGQNGGELIPREILGMEIRVLQRGSIMQWVVVQERVLWHFDTALAPYGIRASATAQLEFGTSSTWRPASSLEFIPFGMDEIAGAWALRIGTLADEPWIATGGGEGLRVLSTALVTFVSDGNMFADFGRSHSASTGTWELDNEGKLLVHGSGGEETIYQKWAEIGASKGILVTYKPTPTETYTQYLRDAKVTSEIIAIQELLGTQADQYWQTTINLSSAHQDEQGMYPDWAYFGFTFESADVAKRLYLVSPPRELIIEDDWSWVVAGDYVQLDRRWDSALTPRCAYTDPSCIAWRRRQWLPIDMDGPQVLVLEWEVWLNRYAEIRAGQINWDASRQQWADNFGNPLDLEDVSYLIMPRLNAYYVATIPPP